MGERFINEEQIGVSREEQLSFFIQSIEARKISRLILLAIYLKGRYPSVFYTFLFASENDYLTVTVRVAVQDGKWKIKGGTEGRILEYKYVSMINPVKIRIVFAIGQMYMTFRLF